MGLMTVSVQSKVCTVSKHSNADHVFKLQLGIDVCSVVSWHRQRPCERPIPNLSLSYQTSTNMIHKPRQKTPAEFAYTAIQEENLR